MATATKQTGVIKNIVEDRGFGFLKPDDGGKDVFFHFSALQGLEFNNSLQQMRVTFDLVQGDKGPRAVNVRKVD